MKKTIIRICAGLLTAAMVCSSSVFAEAAVNLEDFPESYRPYIEQLASAHPTWTFEAYDTGVSWNDLLDYETQINVNLIENTVPDYWLSKEQNVTFNGQQINLYDFSTGKYYILSAPNWVQPRDSVIAYYLDPRNFLNETDVFMFKHMVYNEAYHSEASVNAVLSGSWMHDTYLEDDPSMTYAQAFVKIGKEFGISPFLLASRVVQEQGVGASDMISGKYPGYEGYYNYFNIGATGQSREEIYKNGLEEAKQEGWNTRFKALRGGASKILDRYISRQQTSVYFQKFDVATGQVSWHQYMQNIQAPLSEGRRVRNTYDAYGILDSAFVFRIPIYDNMPANPCAIDRPEIMGDVNFDGLVDSKDALLVLQSVVRLKSLSTEQMRFADVDGNGQIDTNDALYILQYAVRLIKKFPSDR